MEELEFKSTTIPSAQEMLGKFFADKKVKGDEKTKIGLFISSLKDNEILAEDVAIILTPFAADPTFDIAFKMLFCSKEHDQILISLLNNLLDLS